MSEVNALRVHLRHCWVRRDNKRLSRTDGPWEEPCWKAVVIESVLVEEYYRGRGLFKRFLAELCATPDIELVVVEGVQSRILEDALKRWGWECDPAVMDFYHFPEKGPP